MWKAIAVSAALLAVILVLSVARNGHSGLDSRDQFAFEKQQARQRQALLATPPTADPTLSCAAARVTKATVQTLYLEWINHRADLSPAEDRAAATADLGQAIAACGGDADREEGLAHQRGLDLEQEAASAMLRAGR